MKRKFPGLEAPYPSQTSKFNVSFLLPHLIRNKCRISTFQSEDQLGSSLESNEKNLSGETPFITGFQLLMQIASNSKGNIEGTHVIYSSIDKLYNDFASDKLPIGLYEFKSILERMLGFNSIDEGRAESRALADH